MLPIFLGRRAAGAHTLAFESSVRREKAGVISGVIYRDFLSFYGVPDIKLPMRTLQYRAVTGIHTAGVASSKLALPTKIFVFIQWLGFHTLSE